jgi:lipoprotein NlpD
MRMKKSHLLVLGVLATLLSGCTTPTRISAPVENRTINSSSATKGGMQSGTDYHTVKPGETLYRIAQDANQNYRDLVTWNNLANANDIKVGQVLRVVPPSGATPTVRGAEMGTITADTAGIEIRPLNGAQSAPSASINATIVTGPRGDKRPYSEQALAELNKPDAQINQELASGNSVPANVPSSVATTKPLTSASEGEVQSVVNFIWPTEGAITGAYDIARKGVDIAGKPGQAINAAADGKVMYAGSGIRGYGNLVILKHDNNLLTAYAHNREILVKEGQAVTQGQQIAEMGNSDSPNVKLHFEIRQQGKPVDPMPYLPPR